MAATGGGSGACVSWGRGSGSWSGFASASAFGSSLTSACGSGRLGGAGSVSATGGRTAGGASGAIATTSARSRLSPARAPGSAPGRATRGLVEGMPPIGAAGRGSSAGGCHSGTMGSRIPSERPTAASCGPTAPHAPAPRRRRWPPVIIRDGSSDSRDGGQARGIAPTAPASARSPRRRARRPGRAARRRR